MLANIYMHHVLTMWFKLVVKKEMQGECFLVNFADDFVAGFQYKSEAERYYKELKERMEKFGLELESSKSRLIEFGRFAEQNRRARGEHKPETFDFLGFTFYCSKNRKGGFAPKVQTSRKKFEQKVRAYKNWICDGPSGACPRQIPAKKYKVYKSSINKSLHFAQRRLSSSTRG